MNIDPFDAATALARIIQRRIHQRGDGRTEIGIHKKHHMNMDHAAWEGFDIDGHVDTVLSRGKVVIDNDEYLGSKGHGQYLKRGMNQYLI